MHVRNGPEPFDYDSFPRSEQFRGLDRALPEIFEVAPDMTGRFTFRDVPKKGRLYLYSEAAGLAEAQWTNSDQVFERDIVFRFSKEGIARGEIRSPEGKKLPGIEVSARLSGRGRLSPSYLTTFRTTTDDEGQFELRGLPHTEFVLSVSDPKNRWAIQPIENLLIAAGEAKSFEITLEELVSISGRVIDLAGKPIAQAAISVLVDSDEGPGLDHDVTDEDGQYLLRIPPGKAKIYFNALPEGIAYPDPQIVKRLEVESGQAPLTEVNFSLERDE
jgi:hypothetical protein